MFVQVHPGEFLAVDTIASIYFWEEPAAEPFDRVKGDDTDFRLVPANARRGARVLTKRGDKFNVVEPKLLARLEELVHNG